MPSLSGRLRPVRRQQAPATLLCRRYLPSLVQMVKGRRLPQPPLPDQSCPANKRFGCHPVRQMARYRRPHLRHLWRHLYRPGQRFNRPPLHNRHQHHLLPSPSYRGRASLPGRRNHSAAMPEYRRRLHPERLRHRPALFRRPSRTCMRLSKIGNCRQQHCRWMD